MKYGESLFGRREPQRVPPRDNHSAPVPANAPSAGPVIAHTAARPPQPAPPIEVAPKAEDGANARLIVGPNIKLRGVEIDDCDTLVVEGRVEATMVSRAIQIAEHGSFRGKAEIDVAEIRGTFDGELTVRARLVVHATGRVTGKVRYGKLLVQEGGEIAGDVGTLTDTGPQIRPS